MSETTVGTSKRIGANLQTNTCELCYDLGQFQSIQTVGRKDYQQVNICFMQMFCEM